VRPVGAFDHPTFLLSDRAADCGNPERLPIGADVRVQVCFTLQATGGTTMTDHNTATKAAPLHHTMTCTIPFQSFPSP
jgi:hypothetical protein